MKLKKKITVAAVKMNEQGMPSQTKLTNLGAPSFFSYLYTNPRLKSFTIQYIMALILKRII